MQNSEELSLDPMEQQQQQQGILNNQQQQGLNNQHILGTNHIQLNNNFLNVINNNMISVNDALILEMQGNLNEQDAHFIQQTFQQNNDQFIINHNLLNTYSNTLIPSSNNLNLTSGVEIDGTQITSSQTNNNHHHHNTQNNNINSNTSPRLKWTSEMDELLTQAVVKLRTEQSSSTSPPTRDWVAISKEVGNGVTNEQCRNRWSCHLDPELKNFKNGAWNKHEETLLHNLVGKYTNDPSQDKRGHRKNTDSVYWAAVSKEMNRSSKECRSKWGSLKRSVNIQGLKKGSFSVEEDTLLRQRMAELADQQTNTSSSSNGSSGVGGNGSNGVGIWKQLETDFRRSASSIQKRWLRLTREQKPRVQPVRPPPVPRVPVVRVPAAPRPRPPAAPVVEDTKCNWIEVDPTEVTKLLPQTLALTGGLTSVRAVKKALASGNNQTNQNTSSEGYQGRYKNSVPEGSEFLRVTGGPTGGSAYFNANNTIMPDLLVIPSEHHHPHQSLDINGSHKRTYEEMYSEGNSNARVNRHKSSFWTAEKDALLMEAHSLYGSDWVKITEHVGEGANSDRCWQRWNRYLSPEVCDYKTTPWTSSELQKLEDLVITHNNNPEKKRAGRSNTKATIDWTTISKLMQRPYMACKGKWKHISSLVLKHSEFTPEEDQYILESVARLDHKSNSNCTVSGDVVQSTTTTAADESSTSVVLPTTSTKTTNSDIAATTLTETADITVSTTSVVNESEVIATTPSAAAATGTASASVPEVMEVVDVGVNANSNNTVSIKKITKPIGMWVSIARALTRPAHAVRARWFGLTSKMSTAVPSTHTSAIVSSNTTASAIVPANTSKVTVAPVNTFKPAVVPTTALKPVTAAVNTAPVHAVTTTSAASTSISTRPIITSTASAPELVVKVPAAPIVPAIAVAAPIVPVTNMMMNTVVANEMNNILLMPQNLPNTNPVVAAIPHNNYSNYNNPNIYNPNLNTLPLPSMAPHHHTMLAHPHSNLNYSNSNVMQGNYHHQMMTEQNYMMHPTTQMMQNNHHHHIDMNNNLLMNNFTMNNLVMNNNLDMSNNMMYSAAMNNNGLMYNTLMHNNDGSNMHNPNNIINEAGGMLAMNNNNNVNNDGSVVDMDNSNTSMELLFMMDHSTIPHNI